MEVDLLVGQSMSESLERSQSHMEGAVREVQLATLMASSEQLATYYNYYS